MEAHPAVAFPIQADFDTAGMKAFTPIEFFRHRKVMPLEAQPGATHAAMQMAPAVPDRMPDRTFGERRQLVSLVASIGRRKASARRQFADSESESKGKTGVRSSGVRSRESGVGGVGSRSREPEPSRRQETGARSQEPGARSQEPGDRSRSRSQEQETGGEPGSQGAGSREPGARSQELQESGSIHVGKTASRANSNAFPPEPDGFRDSEFEF